MIGIDTNILLRPWLNDDPGQNKRIDTLLAMHGGMPGSLLVTDVFLAKANSASDGTRVPWLNNRLA